MHKILVLQLNRMGDLVQTVPLLCSLRQEYPESNITLMCMQGPHTLVMECGYFNRIIAVTLTDVEALLDFVKMGNGENSVLIQALFSESYDFVINLTNDHPSSLLLDKISAPQKSGRICAPEGEIRLLGSWAKYLFSMSAHRSENLFNLVDIQMGIAGLRTKPQAAALPVLKANSLLADELLNSVGHVAGHTIIAIQTGASQLHRAWSLENFSELCQLLLKNLEVEILLVGDMSEKIRAESLCNNAENGVLDLVGQTSLPVLAAMLQKCSLLISNDTGTIHVAAAVGTPTLGLYFSTAYFSETAPYGQGHVVLQVEIPCAPCHASAICTTQKCREFLPVASVYQTTRWLLNPTLPTPLSSQNLGMYKSYFLANGSLIYLPIHENVSARYLKSLLGRLVWESVFEMTTDPQLKHMWKLFTRNKIIPLIYNMDLKFLFEAGVDFSRQLNFEFSQPAPSKNRVEAFHQNLLNLSKDLADFAMEGGLVGAFLNFEIMDMDYATYPELAHLLESKYQHLMEICSRIKLAQESLVPA